MPNLFSYCGMILVLGSLVSCQIEYRKSIIRPTKEAMIGIYGADDSKLILRADSTYFFSWICKGESHNTTGTYELEQDGEPRITIRGLSLRYLPKDGQYCFEAVDGFMPLYLEGDANRWQLVVYDELYPLKLQRLK